MITQWLRKYWPVLAALLGIAVARLLPVIKFPIQTLAYDYGLYRFAFTHPPALLSLAAFQSYSSPWFVVSKWFALPPEPTLLIVFMLAWLVASIFLFWSTSKWGIRSAIVATVLFALSPAMLQAHTMFLWKNVWGLAWLLLAFTAYTSKRYYLMTVAMLLLLVTHRTTAIFFVVTVVLYLTWHFLSRKLYRQLAGLVAATVIVAGSIFVYFNHTIMRFINHPNEAVTAGIFLDGPEYLLKAFPYVILGCIGVVLSIRQKTNGILITFFSVIVGWMLFDFPFASRALLYADLALIMFAAFASSNLTGKKTKLLVAAVLALTLLLNIFSLVRPEPLISEAQIQEIASFPPPRHAMGFVLTTDAADAPWLVGFLPLSRLAAPGLFEDYHTYEEWQSFWNNQEGGEFFEHYPAPLYIYQRISRVPPIIQPCLDQISPHFYKYTCY